MMAQFGFKGVRKMTTLEVLKTSIVNLYLYREKLGSDIERLEALYEAELSKQGIIAEMQELGLTDVGEYMKLKEEKALAKELAKQ